MKEEKRQAIINSYQRVLDEISERHEYRANNYYNCVDDYSFGSPYHAAADEMVRYEAYAKMIYYLEMLDNGFIQKETRVDILTDLDGNVLATGTKRGKFGEFFVTKNGLVGIPKNLKTLEKKGYLFKNRVRTYRAKFSGKISQKGNAIFNDIEIFTESIEAPRLDDYGRILTNSNEFIDWLFEQQG